MSNKPKMIMMVGIPGSGKSYIAEEVYNEEGAIVHSSDAIREELLGNVNNQDNNIEVFDELHRRVKADLKDGRDTIYDATNISKKRRAAFLRELKGIDCQKICYLVLSTYEDCINRNHSRERNIPDDVIKRMYMKFQPPSLREGWDEIDLIYNPLDGDSFKRYTLEEFFWGKTNACMLDHQNHHHKLSVGDHSLSVYNYLRDKYPNNFILLMGGVLHDIGKPFTKTNMKDGRVLDEYHFYSHQNVGAYDSFFFTHNMNLGFGDRIEIANLIYYHMLPFSWDSRATQEKHKKKIGVKMFANVKKLHEADEACG